MTLALSLLGLGKTLLGAAGSAIGAVLRWVVADVRNALIVGLALALAWSAWMAHGARGERDRWQATAGKFERAAGKALDAAWAWKGAYDRYDARVRAAAAAAAAADRAHSAAVNRQIDQIRERTADDYQARLDDTRAALERVRGQYAALAASGAAAGRDGDGGAAAVPAALTARCQALGAADCDALLAALPGQLGAAEDNTAKLIALQDYVRGLLAIDFSGGAPAADTPEQAK